MVQSPFTNYNHQRCKTLEGVGPRWIDDRKGVPGFAQFSFDEHFNPEFDRIPKLLIILK